jgi:uncharacterized protein with GYD domain
MATYIVLAKWTDKGFRAIRDWREHEEEESRLARRCDVEIRDLWKTMGGYDSALIVEAPNDVAVARFASAIDAGGNAGTTTLRAFSRAEAQDLVSTIPIPIP